MTAIRKHLRDFIALLAIAAIALAVVAYVLGNPPQGQLDPERSTRLATAIAADFGRTSWHRDATAVEVRGATARIVTDLEEPDA